MKIGNQKSFSGRGWIKEDREVEIADVQKVEGQERGHKLHRKRF